MKICYLFTSLNLKDMTDELSTHLDTEGAVQFLILRTLAKLDAAVEKMGSENPTDIAVASIKAQCYRDLIEQVGDQITDEGKKAKWLDSRTKHYRALATTISLDLR